MLNPKNMEKYIEKKDAFRFLVSFIVTLVCCYVLFQFFFEITTVSGDSMNPTLINGDIDISVKTEFTDIKRGDIVNINSEYLGEGIVKRVIAVGGDKIEITKGKVYLNNEILNEPYIKEPMVQDDTALIEIPVGSVFVMGDNRNNSLDSRSIGYVSKAEIKSKVILHIKR